MFPKAISFLFILGLSLTYADITPLEALLDIALNTSRHSEENSFHRWRDSDQDNEAPQDSEIGNVLKAIGIYKHDDEVVDWSKLDHVTHEGINVAKAINGFWNAVQTDLDKNKNPPINLHNHQAYDLPRMLEAVSKDSGKGNMKRKEDPIDWYKWSTVAKSAFDFTKATFGLYNTLSNNFFVGMDGCDEENFLNNWVASDQLNETNKNETLSSDNNQPIQNDVVQENHGEELFPDFDYDFYNSEMWLNEEYFYLNE